MEGARVSDFFTKNPNLKKNFLGGGRWVGCGRWGLWAGVSDYFTLNPYLK